jgi:AcrR family transcriptional regulator
VEHVARRVKPQSSPPTRRYDSPARRAKAQETEARILEAAAALFAERGYVATSLAAVAEQAGVNARTVYKVFGTKVRLLSRFVDVAIVGDQEAIPVAERSWAEAAFHARAGRERVQAYAATIRRVMSSAGPAFRVAAQAAAADVEAAELWGVGQRLRLEDSTAFVTALHDAQLLRRGSSRPEAVTTVWLLTSPETFTQLHDGLGWTLDQYERWLTHTLEDALLDPAAT